MNQNPRRVCLAKIATAHGVRGLVKLFVHTEDPQSLEDYGPLFTSESGTATLKLTLANQMNKFWLAEIEGITDRNAAEKLRGTELWIDRDRLPEPEAGQHYYTDLVGLPALDDSGNEVGKIISVANFGASDLLEIQPPSSTSFYLPFVKDYVLQIDKDHVTVFVPQGIRQVPS